YLGWEEVMPKFAHLPLLLKPDGTGKLSKRDGDRLGFPVFPLDWEDPKTGEKSSGYKQAGYLPEAVINLLAFLGWNPGTHQELFSLEELVAAFTLERVGKHGAKFDQNKAKWYNQQYVRKVDNHLLAPSLKAALALNIPDATFSDEYIEKVVIKKRYNEKVPQLLSDLIEAFSAITEFTHTNTEATYNAVLAKNEVASKDFLQLFRVCLSGVAGGPPIFEMVEIFGKDRTIQHLNKAATSIKG
ncbi:MAG: glutamate--tRNA ligase, partial [Bacteroidetes bacterium]|nr:glutamate--tRNA ligase [Bacteroidota bacterium]